MADRTPGERWVCSCGTRLVAARTISGKTAPITVLPRPDGNVWLGRGTLPCPSCADVPFTAQDCECNGTGLVPAEVRCATIAGPLLDKAREQGMALYLNHFADCPDRQRYTRKKETTTDV